MKNEKIVKTSVVVDRILKILQGFFLAGMIVSAIFLPLTAAFGEKIIASSNTLSVGVMQFRLTGSPESYLDIPNIRVSIIVALVGMILALAAGWYCLKVLREILSPMKEGMPFAEGISGKIRKLGWTVLIGGGVAELGKLISAIFDVRAYNIELLLNPAVVESYTYNLSVDLSFVIAALILFLLSYIFQCGEDLQRESDETL